MGLVRASGIAGCTMFVKNTGGMSSGLDGNPEPVVSPARNVVLDRIVEKILDTRQDRDRVLVGIDGQSGTGKSTLADELAMRLGSAGANVVRSSTDSFHRPRSERLGRGANSPEGYYLDSHQLESIVEDLLGPFAAGAEVVQTSAFDEPSDAQAVFHQPVGSQATLVFDGLFVHRPEFVGFWDVSVLLVADERRDGEWLEFLLGDLPESPVERAHELDQRLDRARWPRYRRGWQHYLEQVDPAALATFVVDNNDFVEPSVN